MLIAWTAVAAGAASQTVAGFGFALVSAPFLIAVVGPDTGVRMVITLSCLISLMLLVRSWRRARTRDAVLLALPGVVLAVPLALLVGRLDQHVLTVAAGLVTLASAAALTRQVRPAFLRGVGGLLAVGAVSAAMNALGGLSGPTAALYAVNRGWPRETITPTLQIFGIVLNIASLASLGGTALDWRLVLALPLGWAAGSLVIRRLTAEQARRAILTVAAVGGLVAVARGFGAV